MVRFSVEEKSDKIFVTEEFEEEFLFFSALNALRVGQEVVNDCVEQLYAILNCLNILFYTVPNRLDISFLLELLDKFHLLL